MLLYIGNWEFWMDVVEEKKFMCRRMFASGEVK